MGHLWAMEYKCKMSHVPIVHEKGSLESMLKFIIFTVSDAPGMKRKIPVVTFFFLFFLHLASQPVITSENTPEAGHEYFFQMAEKPGIQPPPTGENIIWDYSDIELLQSFESKGYMVPALLKEQDEEYLDPVDPDLYDFSSLDTNLLYYLDDNSFKLAFYYDTYASLHIGFTGYLDWGITLLQFPFTYGDSISDETNFGNDSESLTLKAVAYGRLILPDTTYNPVIMLHRDDYYLWDLGITGAHQVYSEKFLDVYEFYSEDSDLPVFTIEFDFSYSICDDQEFWKYDTTLMVYDHTEILNSTMISENQIDCSVTPNPFRDRTVFEISCPVSANASLLIFNSSGLKVDEIYGISLSHKKTTIEYIRSPGLSSGVYFYLLRAGNKSASGKLVFI